MRNTTSVDFGVEAADVEARDWALGRLASVVLGDGRVGDDMLSPARPLITFERTPRVN